MELKNKGSIQSRSSPKTAQYSISSPIFFPGIFSSLTALTSIKSRTKGSFKPSSAPLEGMIEKSSLYFFKIFIINILVCLCEFTKFDFNPKAKLICASIYNFGGVRTLLNYFKTDLIEHFSRKLL